MSAKKDKESEKKENDKKEAEVKEAGNMESEDGKKESADKESESHKEAEADGTKQPASVDDGGEDKAAADSEQHDDVASDEELIKKMLNKYIGDPQHDASIMQQAKEAYEACKKSGMDESEAMKAVGHSMKVAKAMSGGEVKLPDAEASAMESESEKKEALDVGAGHKSADGIDGHHPSEAKSGAKSMAPVAEASKVKELTDKMKLLEGELAGMKAKLKLVEAEKYLDQKLQESGIPRAVTKEFREKLTIKSKDQVESELTKFLEGYRKGQGQVALDYDAVINPERIEIGATSNGGFDYDACIEN